MGIRMGTSIDNKKINAVDIQDSSATGRSVITGDAATGRQALGAVAGPETSTLDAIAKYSDTIGNLANSSATLSSAGLLTTPNLKIDSPGATSPFATYYANGVLRSDLAETGAQNWYLKAAGVEIGTVSISTPGSSVGITFQQPGNTNRFDFKSYVNNSIAQTNMGYSQDINSRPAIAMLANTSGNVMVGIRNLTPKVVGLHISGGFAVTTPTGVASTTDPGDGNAYFQGTVKIGSTGTALVKVLSAIATLDFPSIAAQSSATLTITVTGAAVGDTVVLGLPASPATGVVFNAFVSASNTVTIRATNITGAAIDPASASYRVAVIGF